MTDAPHATRLVRVLSAPLAPDAVRQWPQSGEVVAGRERIAEVESHFEGLKLRVGRRLAADGGVVVEVRDGEAVRVTYYWGEPFTQPARPASLSEPLDMPSEGIWPSVETPGGRLSGAPGPGGVHVPHPRERLKPRTSSSAAACASLTHRSVRAVRRRSEVRDRLGRVVDLDVDEPEATAAVTAVQPTKRLGLLRGPIAVLRQQRGRIRKCEHRAPRRCHSSTAAVQHRSWTRRPTRLGFSQREWSHRHLITRPSAGCGRGPSSPLRGRDQRELG